MKKTIILVLAIGFTTALCAQECTTIESANSSSEVGNANMPATYAGKAAQKLIEVINSGEENQAEAFIKNEMTPKFRDQFPMSMHLDLFKMMQSKYSNIQVVGLRMNSDHDLTFMGKSKDSGKMMRVSLQVEHQEPYKLASLGLEPDATFDAQPSKEESTLGNIDDLDSYLTNLAKTAEFSGAVLLAKDGNVLFENAYGFADIKMNRLNRVDTKFNLGSLNKFITATAVLQLMEEDKIDLNATLDVYTDIFPQNVGSKVTVRHLLQHKAGWSHYWDNEYFNSNLHNLKSIDDYMVFIKKIPLDFEPGTRQQYSNTGYEVLGHIIEKASGMSYDDFVQNNIYDKIGMSNTGAFEQDNLISNAAIGYTMEGGNGKLISNTDVLPIKGTAAGGGYSTVRDFLKFESALFNHQLVNKESLALMFNNYEPGKPFNSKEMKLAGGAPGVSTNWVKNFETGYSAFVFTNRDMGSARPVSTALMKVAEGLDDSPKEVSIYTVHLSCGAAPEIGCGIATKPVLLKLQQQKEVKSASLNRPGTAIAITWNKPTTKADRDNIVLPVFEDFGMNAKETSGGSYEDLLASYQGDDHWYMGSEVDQLSIEEADGIGKKVTATIREYRSLSEDKALKMEADIRNFFEEVLTKDYEKNEFEEGDVTIDWTPNVKAIVEKYVGKDNFPEEVNFKFGVNPASKKSSEECCSSPGKTKGCDKACCNPGDK